MDSGTIRNTFLSFFAKKGHDIIPSAPLVAKDDPSLLFTNSGMVQFKDYFLGHAIPANKRITDTQLCIRVSGKHNDLDDVGHDTYHHTLFEMLGNWSFGDYFKKEAIAWAWELLTKSYGLAPDRFYITVFGGDDKEQLPVDEEAIAYWEPIVGRDRIIFGSKEDNFWEMGDTGPCGPCSEIHIDMRSKAERGERSGRELVNANHPQVIEIWNLVFIQFNRLASGRLEDLPEKHVDTGMGFERLCSVIQGKKSNYDTDIFVPLIDFIANKADISYGKDERKDTAIRVLADHARAVAFTIADGQLPSNVGAGYVVRRILRRAVRYGLSYLGFKDPFLHLMVPLLANPTKDVFPALYRRQQHVAEVMFEEERSFLKTLEKGIHRIDDIQADLNGSKLSGKLAFELYDTYGFPLDLTVLIARERGFGVDEQTFLLEMEKQKARSRSDAAKREEDWVVVHDGEAGEFIGYEKSCVSTRLLRYRKVHAKDKYQYQLVFAQTPYYSESGGQVGDIGIAETHAQKIDIVDTKKENNLIVHIAHVLPTDVKDNFELTIDVHRRLCITRNHSATHLLHAALRQVLGNHVEQRGSLVNDHMLRFDFSHFKAMTEQEIDRVEYMVNNRIRMNITCEERRNIPIEQAKAMGAMALFGEKYGNIVRVVAFDSAYSIELCGGTHVAATGDIGFFKVVSESAIAAGVRRIEAVTAEGAEEYVYKKMKLLDSVGALFKHPNDLLAAAGNILSDKQRLEKKLSTLYRQQADIIHKTLAKKGRTEGGVYAIIERLEVASVDMLRDIAYALRNRFDDLFLTLAAEVEGRPHLIVMLGKKIAQRGVLHAGKIIKILAVEIDGGGGGQSFFAIAGGKKLAGLENVLKKARHIVHDAHG